MMRSVVAFGVSLAACSGSNSSDESLVDAGVDAPDALFVEIDATPALPDAQPDAPPALPDAQPDAPPAPPDATQPDMIVAPDMAPAMDMAVVRDADIADAAPVMPTLSQTAYIKASTVRAGQTFGSSVCISGDGRTIAIGAPGDSSAAYGINGDEASTAAPASGAVYVFHYDAGTWSQQAYVKASNTDASDSFGDSVALSYDGSTLAVGAKYESSGADGVGGSQTDDSAAGAGAVYVFRRSASTWTQQAYIKASNSDAADGFGEHVALSASGDVLAVGALYEDSNATSVDGSEIDNSADDSGAAYVFRFSAMDGWNQEAYVKASNTQSGDQFGSSIALSDDGATLAVGAQYEDSGATGVNGDQFRSDRTSSGAVYVFRRGSIGWSQQAYVKASNTDLGDRFGASVALGGDGDVLVVGAWEESSGSSGVGGDQLNDDASSAGAVYVFDYTTAWSQSAYIKASNPDAQDLFGLSVAVSNDGDFLIVSATGEASRATGIGGDQSDDSASDSGAAYYFSRSSGSWVQLAYVKASNAQQDDRFGRDVSITADGQSWISGAIWEDSGASGIGGDETSGSASNAGAAYVFVRR